MSTNRRARIREATREEIKTLARQQMMTEGTAALSLRGIATLMGVTPTALYRYFDNRDALLTELILDAYHALADSLAVADAACPPDTYAQRMLSVLLQYRTWALTYPTDFQLIFGNPIPGYNAPDDTTMAAASRNMGVFVRVLGEALAAGAWQPPAISIPPTVALQLSMMNFYGVPDALLYMGMVGWARIHGMIMLELFQHSTSVVGDPAAFYEYEVRALMRELGM